jgi:hypothetical protein
MPVNTMVTPLRCDGSQPVLSFSVTGTEMALTTAFRMRATKYSSRNKADLAGDIAYLFRWTPHVDVDDLCAVVDM